VRVSGHDRDDTAVGDAPAQLVDQLLRLVEVADHAVAQDARETPAAHGRLRRQSVGLHEPHPALDCLRQSPEAPARLRQHRRRRVEHRHVVSRLGQRERLVAGAATDVEQRPGWGRQVLHQLLVHDVGPHAALHGGIRIVGERVGQACPEIIGHLATIGAERG